MDFKSSSRSATELLYVNISDEFYNSKRFHRTSNHANLLHSTINDSTEESLNEIEHFLKEFKSVNDVNRLMNEDHLPQNTIHNFHIQLNHIINLLKAQQDKIEELESTLWIHSHSITVAYEKEIHEICGRARSKISNLQDVCNEKDEEIESLQKELRATELTVRFYEEQFGEDELKLLQNLRKFYQRAADIVRFIDKVKTNANRSRDSHSEQVKGSRDIN